MVNKRIFYAAQQVSISDTQGDVTMTAAEAVKGVQSVGIATNYNLEQVFELGKLSIYENIEEIPDVSITLSKVLDGNALIYHMATQEASLADAEPTLVGRSNTSCQVGLGIYPDTDTATSGESAVSAMVASGMFISDVSYSFPLDGNASEDVTLVGNNKAWRHQPNYGDALNSTFSGYQSNIDVLRGISESDSPADTDTAVSRRQDLLFGDGGTAHNKTLDTNGQIDDADLTVLPPEIFGITNSGTNEKDSDGNFGAHLSNITVSATLGREQINELGRKSPYHRFVSFPVEVTTEVEATSHSGDMVSAIEDGIFNTGTAACDGSDSNLKDRTIRIAVCEGTRIYCGLKNKLSAVNYGGGGTDGGNVTVTWTWTTFNDMTVIHPQDPHGSGAAWWNNRATYLEE